MLIVEIIEENKKSSGSMKNDISVLFEGKKTASVPVKKYVTRLVKYFSPEPASLIIALIYLDRICEFSKIKLAMENFHRIFLTALVVSIKYSEDKYYSNTFYSKIGGILLADLNQLEAIFLNAIQYSLFVNGETFDKYVTYLRTLIKMRKNP